MGNVLSRQGRKIKYASLAFVLYYAYTRLLAKRKRRKRHSKKAEDDNKKSTSGALSMAKVKKKIWSVVMPRSFTDIGAKELLCLLALHIYRVPLLLRLSYAVQEGDRVLFTRNVPAYWKAMRSFLQIAVEQTIVMSVSTYLKTCLNIKWRRKITKYLHKDYFEKSNYYHVESMLKDVDARMTEDVEETATGYSNFLNALVFNGTTGVFYLSKLWYEYGFLYAASPFFYIVGAATLVRKIVPFDFKIFSKLSAAKGTYRNAQTRLVVHSEAIAALRGAAREQTILEKLFDTMNSIQRDVHQRLLPFNATNTFFLRQLLGCVVGWFVLGPGVFRKKGKLSIEGIAQIRADAGYQFILFIQVMYSASYGQRVLTAFNKIQGPARRIVELFGALKTVTKRQASEKIASFKNGNKIAFKDVDIFTPTGNLLVKDLSFEVTGENDSLLLTGHNGAGKSSIFLCLAGLWKIPKGEITKPMTPGSTSLSGEVFYLPQKPYNVIGTLTDQLTYPQPAKGAGDLSTQYLTGILDQVELAYLAERDGAFTEEINWEDALSLGEKQRLAIARLIHHKPRFAILDECTSGVAASMERSLYLLLNDMGISYITISHRPVLEQMHCKFLCIKGDSDKSYEYKVLRNAKQLKAELQAQQKKLEERAFKGGTQGAGGTEQALMAFQSNRSKPYGYIADERTKRQKDMKAAFKTDSAMVNLSLVLKNGLPKGWRNKLTLVLVGIVGQAFMTDVQLWIETEIWRALFQRDQFLFFRTALNGVLGALVTSALNAYSENVQNKLEVDMRESLTKKFMNKYMTKAGFYNLKNFDGRVMDPEARLTDDLSDFVEMLSSLVLEVIKPSFTVLWLGLRLTQSVGIGKSSALYGYLFAAGILARATMPDFKSMVAEKGEKDGKYKYSCSSVRTHCESIAFFGGGNRERAIAWKRFESALKVEEKKAKADLWFGCIKNFFVRNMPDRVQQHLRFQFALDNFKEDTEIFKDGGAALSMGQHMIWGIQNAVKRSVQDLVDVSDKFNNLSGVIFRLAELEKTLDDLHVPGFMKKKLGKHFGEKTKQKNAKISIQGLDIVTPTGTCLASSLSVEVTSSNRLLVTGPNASGKTSFFRVLGGIWPTFPTDNAEALLCNGDLFLVPQRVYSVTGTLLDQVTYPIKIEQGEVERDGSILEGAQKLLDLVGIGYLVGRDGGWHLVRKFEDVLSLGEQQRLGMARLFFHNPSFAVLDECTDAVSVDVEERLYTAAMEMGIVCITISKRLALVNFHEQEICLGTENECGFEIKEL
jgi:ABC-type uncharacterized transport system fused permease/ATPase subunit